MNLFVSVSFTEQLPTTRQVRELKDLSANWGVIK